jgi:hypothetical protein
LFCDENELSPSILKSLTSPALTVCYLLKHLSQLNTPAYLIRESLTAVRRLLEVSCPGSVQQLKESGFLKDSIRAALSEVVRSTKYREIWKLEILLDFTRKGPPSEELSVVELIGRAAAVSMVFIPCRTIGMWRMRVEESKQTSGG